MSEKTGFPSLKMNFKDKSPNFAAVESNKRSKTESSNKDFSDDFGLFGTIQYTTAAYQKVDKNAYTYPATHLSNRKAENMSKEEFPSLKRNFEDKSPNFAALARAAVVSNKKSQTESSSKDFSDDFGLFGTIQFTTAAYQKVDENAYTYPAHIKNKENMKISDIVKELSLPFLPAKSLIRFKSVSKEWDQWISNPFLAHNQSHSFGTMSGYFCQTRTDSGQNPISFITLSKPSYGVPSPSLSFLPGDNILLKSSCNGLLLCQGKEENYYICNPVTEKWKQIPPPKYYHGNNPRIVLAFEPSIMNMESNYHIICAVPLLDHPAICFETYSSETKTWKVSDSCCVELEKKGLKKNGFYANGVVYWETFENKVLAFDLKTEVYGVISLPEPCRVLRVIGGEMCYVCALVVSCHGFEIEVYGGLNMDKIKSVGFDLGSWCEYVRVLPCIEDEAVMVLVGGVLYSCNLDEGKVEKVATDGLLDRRGKYVPYVNSLVSVA